MRSPISALRRSPSVLLAVTLALFLWPVGYLALGVPLRLPTLLYPALLCAWGLFVLLVNNAGRSATIIAPSPPQGVRPVADLLRQAGFLVRESGGRLDARRGVLDIVTGGVESEWAAYPLHFQAQRSDDGSTLRLRAVSRGVAWTGSQAEAIARLRRETVEAVAALDPARLSAADRTVVFRQGGLLGGGLATRVNATVLAGIFLTAAALTAYATIWWRGTAELLDARRLADQLEWTRAATLGPGAPLTTDTARRLRTARMLPMRGPAEVALWHPEGNLRIHWDAQGRVEVSDGPARLPEEILAAERARRDGLAPVPGWLSWLPWLHPGAMAEAIGILHDTPDGRRTLYQVAPGPGGLPQGWSISLPRDEGGGAAAAAESGLLGLLPILIALLSLLSVLSITVALRLTRPLTALRDAMGRIGEGDFSVRLPGRTADEIGQLERAVNAAAGALQQRERLRELFGKYLSRQVAERVLSRPAAEVMAGEQKEISILFADVRGFTTFSERHSPPEVVAALNEYFSAVVDVIATHEGVLDKFIGDGLMAVFGAPMEQPDHARRAVATALEMQAAVRALNARRVQRGEEPIAVGIGVNTGPAVSGDLGSPNRVEYTVVGDSVNLASRLEHQAAKGEVLVGPETYARVKDIACCEPLGAFPIKGKQEMVQVYRVTGLRLPGPG